MPTPFKLQTVQINGFPIDVTITESHDYAVDVTQYPVETGIDITDNSRPKPLKISMEAFVSDTPLGTIASDSTRQSGAPSASALAMLLAVRDAGEPVTIITSLGTYKNMLMSNLSIPRESGEGFQLRFKVDFVQVLFITNNRTIVRVATRTPLGARLALLGVQRVTVYTRTAAQLTGNEGTPVLVDSSGSHFYAQPGVTPPADGYCDDAGYHPYLGTYQPSVGGYTYNDAQVAKYPALIQNASDNQQALPGISQTQYNNMVTGNQAQPEQLQAGTVPIYRQ
jgi:hypothetical protein